MSGQYHLDPVYFDLPIEECIEYDKKFPPKELFKPASIELLLPLLEPDARVAITGLNCATLNFLSTKSEREIRLLEGIDDKAVETIRRVMKENGVKN